MNGIAVIKNGFGTSSKLFLLKFSEGYFRFLKFFLNLALLMVLSFPGLASQAYSAPLETVRIGWFQSPDFQEGMADDAPKSGFSYEYIQKVAGFTGWKYEFVYGGWTELLAKLSAGQIDMLAGVSDTEERRKTLLFPHKSMGEDRYVLYKRKDVSGMDAGMPDSFRGKTVGAIVNNRMSIHLEKWIRENRIPLEIRYYSSFEDRNRDFSNKKLDGLVTTDNDNALQDKVSVARIGGEPFYLAVTGKKPQLKEKLDLAQNLIYEFEPLFVEENQFSHYNREVSKIKLSRQETDFINANKNLRIGYLTDYLPFCTEGANGLPHGALVDICQAISRKMNLKDKLHASFQPFKDYSAMTAALREGRVDVIFPVGGTSWDIARQGVSASLCVVDAGMSAVYRGSYDPKKFSTIAIARASSMQYYFAKANYPQSKILFFDSLDECFDAVLNGKAGVSFINGLRTDFVTRQSRFDSLNVLSLHLSNGRYFGVRQGQSQLLTFINRGLKAIGRNFAVSAAYGYANEIHQPDLIDYIRRYYVSFSSALLAVLILLALFFGWSASRYHKIADEKTQLTRQLEKATESAKTASKAKTSFLFNMSHDIRTPMNAIMGYRDLLEKYQDDPAKRADYLKKIGSASSILLSIINNVLEMARIEKGTVEIDESAWDAGQFNDTLYSVFNGMMRQKGLTFTRQIDVKNHCVYCDPTKLREIFINLLSNAYKYTDAGGSVSMHLEEIPSDRPGWVLYRTTISDTGRGMSEEFLPHLYEEFSREHSSTDSKVEGTGLGMPIVKRLVDMLHGTIEVHSRKGVGTTFIVTLPHRIAEKAEQKKQDAGELDPDLFKGKRILLAEDNDLNAEIAMVILNEAGFLVDRACDGKECVDRLKALEAGHYDLILMDIQMPVMNGYEACRMIRGMDDAGKAEVPILAMTANAFEEDRREALRSGMNGHVAKPVSIQLLMEELAKVLKPHSTAAK